MKETKKLYILALLMVIAIACSAFVEMMFYEYNDNYYKFAHLFTKFNWVCLIMGVFCLLAAIVHTISNINYRSKEKRERNMQTDASILPEGIIYRVDGVRGRQLEVYKDRCVLKVNVTAGSLITGNYSDGEKTIYYADCIGVQFKESGIQIGYLQLETATGLMNNRSDNFFNENSFTFDESVVTNEKMKEIANYIRERISEAKSKNNSTVIAQVSSADELKKYKELLDSGVITQEEFDAKKKQLLGL